MHNMGPWRKLRTAMSSTNQSASPRHEVEVAENLKPSPPNSVGDGDAFAELGPSLSESDELGFGLTKQMHKVSSICLPHWKVNVATFIMFQSISFITKCVGKWSYLSFATA